MKICPSVSEKAHGCAARLKSPSRRDKWNLFSLAVPGLLVLVAFYYVPLFGLVIPFKKIDYAKGIWNSDWCGLDNFKFFFESQDAWRVTRNTVGLNAIFIALTMVLSVILALLLFELKSKEVKVYQTSMFVPYFISWVVASYILYAFINPEMGAIPHLMKSLGKPVVNYYYEPKIWPGLLTAAYLWKNIGYMTLLFYASLMGIDPTYYEAAAIDGATKMQRTLYISLPQLKPIIVMMTLLQIGRIFNSDFGLFYFLTKNSGALYEVTDVIDTYVYRTLRVTGDIGMSAAVGLYQSVVGFVLILASNWFVKKTNGEFAIF